MLSKCANPTCASIFRYLHEGRLYVIGPGEALAQPKAKRASKFGQVEYAWLCASCSHYLTIQVDAEFGARVVRKLGANNGSKSGTSANNSTNANVA
jgi:hypothetical protein